MKKFLACAAFAVSTCTAALAAPASPASVEQLLVLTRADQVMDIMYAGLEQNMRQGMTAMVGNRTLTPEQQQFLQALPAKLSQVMRQELSWNVLKPVFLSAYAETFDQEEIDGLIAFYQSPIGQRFAAKQAPLAQRSAAATQQLMMSVMPKMQGAMEAAMKEAGLR
jgi:uncharacterized protein